MNELACTFGLRLSPETSSGFTLAHLRKLLTYPNWNGFVRLISYTRSYADGLQMGAILLDYIDQHRSALDPKEVAAFEPLLYMHCLAMLDKLDLWDKYLQAWDWVRMNTNYASTYARDARSSHGQRIEPFIISQGSSSIQVHFLYGTSSRRAIIERKLARLQAGRSIGNLVHEQKAELTRDEIQERFDWMMKFIETGKYDFSPPASRQRGRRVKC
jgi:hypothetical protein